MKKKCFFNIIKLFMFVSVRFDSSMHDTDAGMMHLIAYAGDLQTLNIPLIFVHQGMQMTRSPTLASDIGN